MLRSPFSHSRPQSLIGYEAQQPIHKLVGVIVAKTEPGLPGKDEVLSAAHTVRDDRGNAKAHRLVYDEAPRLIISRRK
jgi:hypothetical protein